MSYRDTAAGTVGAARIAADSRRPEDLVPEAAQKAALIRSQCEAAGFGLLIYCTLRPLEQQAILYRQGHASSRVEMKADQLRSEGYDFLADILIGVGPQPTGRSVTEAGPGESWHNYAEAFDAVPLISGREMWNYNDAPFEWDMYGQLVREAGMTWGGDWTKLRDYPHAQIHLESNPLWVYGPEEARAVLTARGLLA